MATDEPIRSKADTPATSDSQAAKTEMGQKMAWVVYQRRSLRENGRSRHADDFKPMDEKRASVAAQQSIDMDDPVPLCIVRPESVDTAQEKHQGFPYKERANKTRANKTSSGLAKTCKRKRGRQAGSKFDKGNIEQKPALFDGSSGSSTYSKGDQDDYLDPPTPTRKSRRPARSKSFKNKIGYVDNNSSSEGKKDKHYDFEPEVSDDDGPRKYSIVKGSAWDRAKEVKKKLPAEGPSFVKLMLPSHVAKGFWLGLPAAFCRKNLPKGDVDIVLEDEEGLTCETKYKAKKTGLSGKWGGFAKQHDLKVDDALIFQLVEPTRFKVYILRKNKFTTTDGALGLLSLDTSTETNTSKKKEKESSIKDTKSKKVPRKKKKNAPEVVTRVSRKPSSNYSDNLASKEAAGGGIGYGGPDTGDFVDMESLQNFHILVGDGSFVGHLVLPDRQRMAYGTLCYARKAFLHRHLPKHTCPTVLGEMIVQTANIAEGIMAVSPDSLEDLASWNKTLGSFESQGMDVAFMRERVHKLIALLSTLSSSPMEEPEGYEKLKLERDRAAENVRALESRISVLKDCLRKIDVALVEMEEMVEASAEERDQAVRNLATAPW